MVSNESFISFISYLFPTIQKIGSTIKYYSLPDLSLIEGQVSGYLFETTPDPEGDVLIYYVIAGLPPGEDAVPYQMEYDEFRRRMYSLGGVQGIVKIHSSDGQSEALLYNDSLGQFLSNVFGIKDVDENE